MAAAENAKLEERLRKIGTAKQRDQSASRAPALFKILPSVRSRREEAID
jgi:hypothetical protein